MMGSPIATQKKGFMCFAFPDVCKTQMGSSQVPIPYPNIGDLKDATHTSKNVVVGGDPVILEKSGIPDQKTTGDEAGTFGSIGGDPSGLVKGKVVFTGFSKTVFVNDQGVVRMFDPTKQNNGNAVGSVLSGVPTVLVGD